MSPFPREPLAITGEAIPDGTLRVTALVLDEAIGRPWRAEVEAVQPARAAPLASDRLIAASVAIRIRRDTDSARTWEGVITACASEPAGTSWRRWRLTVEHRCALLAIGRRSRLLRDRDAVETARGILDAEADLRRAGDPRPQLVQWRESDLAWCQRLLEHEGVSLLCVGDRVRLADHPHAFPDPRLSLPWRRLPADAPAPIDPSLRPAVRSWCCRTRAMPASSVVRDWNWRTPQAPIERAAGTGGGWNESVDEDTPHHPDAACAARLAAVRAEEQRCAAASWHGEADHPGIAAGHILRIAAPDEASADGAWLITAVVHRAEQTLESSGAGGASYRCAFDAWPADRPWRPARRTPVPRLPGLVHAVVDGPEAAVYADPDADGCYRVRPAWARDGAAGMAVRLATPYAGDGHGLHLPLHAGTEVLLAHIDGDPDRPVIAAAVPNPAHASVVTDANASQCVLRSAGGNELVLEDAVGREVWRETATRDRRAVVGGDDDTRIAGNRTAAVSGSDTVAVQGDATTTVGRASAETVAGAKALTVGGAMQVSVGGVLNTSVGGAMAEQVGAAKSEIVAGLRSVAVGGDCTATVAGDQSEHTVGDRQIRARRLRIAIEDELALTCGKASIVLKRNGDVVIRGGAISIDGSGAVTVKGAKVKAN